MGGVCSVECGQHWLCRMSVHCEAAGRSLSGMSCLRRITWGSPGPSTSPATSASEFRPTPPRPTSLPALQAPLRRGDPHGDLHRGLAPPADGVRSRLGRDRDRKVLSKAQNLSFLAILMIRCGGTGGADPHQQPRGGHTGGPQPPQDVQRVSGGGLNSHPIIFSISSWLAIMCAHCTGLPEKRSASWYTNTSSTSSCADTRTVSSHSSVWRTASKHHSQQSNPVFI